MTNIVRFRPRVGFASGRREGWAKHVTDIDPSQKGGYQFKGTFLKAGVETELPEGAVILHVDPTGSVKNWGKKTTVCRLEADGEETELTDKPLNWSTDSLTVRDIVKQALNDYNGTEEANPAEEATDDQLLAEIRRRGLLEQ